MSNGPPASQLCLMSALASTEVGEKVRFLGCVASYSPNSATLELFHPRPEDTARTRALVNVDLLLDRLGPQQMRVGEWVNVMGYITSIADGRGASGTGTSSVHVQALLVWSAGGIDVQRYEATVGKMASRMTRTSGDIPSDALLRSRR